MEKNILKYKHDELSDSLFVHRRGFWVFPAQAEQFRLVEKDGTLNRFVIGMKSEVKEPYTIDEVELLTSGRFLDNE